MATALPTYDGLKCSRCLKNFKTPKILPCGHSICLECLVGYIYDGVKTFPCPVCEQKVKIPKNGVDGFITNSGLERLIDFLTTQPSTNLRQEQDSPIHSKKGAENYCINIDHNDHAALELLLKSKQNTLKNTIKELENTDTKLLETSNILKLLCNGVCYKIGEKTKKIVDELELNCEKIQKETLDHFEMNATKLTETRQRVRTLKQTIESDLDKTCPTTTDGPSLIQSLNILQDLQKLCENKIDIPQVTCVEWREGSGIGNLSDIIGSTEIKPLDQSRVGSGAKSTAAQPLDQSRVDSGAKSTAAKPLDQSSVDSETESTAAKPLEQSRVGSEAESIAAKPLDQSRVDSETKSTAAKPLGQSRVGSEAKSPAAKPLGQSRVDSEAESTAAKPLDQSRVGSGAKSTAAKPLDQSRVDSETKSTAAKPLGQSRVDSEAKSTAAKALDQSRVVSGSKSTAAKPQDQSRVDSGPKSTAAKPPGQSRVDRGFILNVSEPPIRRFNERDILEGSRPIAGSISNYLNKAGAFCPEPYSL